MLRKLDGLGSRVRTGAGNHWHALVGLIDAPFDDLLVFAVRQSWAFAGGSDRNQTLGALGDLPVHNVAEGLFIERAVFERRDQRSERAPEARLGGHGTISPLGGLQAPINIGSGAPVKALHVNRPHELA